MPATPRSEKTIFLEASEIASAGQRAAYLDQACAGDPQLRAAVEALLAAHFGSHEILDAPSERTEPPGTIIGPYRIVEQIGEGGMGVVYLAEQSQPVQRRVALKIVKPGMDSGQVIARFEAEKQALAMMDHPNIARVLDAGATEQGRPYFVMELVDGDPITRYCDEHHLSLRQRLELFVPVCQAIQHAHQKGIIHRDIKPSNVLITVQDGKPVPKVIDFGVAKAIEVKLTEQTLFTHHGMLIGTLEYMSSEQAEPGPQGVDTRSDIYSLGVLLYELLTGSTPLDRQRVRQAAYGEILRLIKEEDPPKPSTRLSQSGESLASISALRQTEPARLTKLLRGELDWIVMKSLEKEPARRYDAASALAADIQRFLNDEPVEASPPSRAYRLRKFVRRNRLVIGTAAIVAASLLTGTILASWQAARATAAATRAAAAEGLATTRLNEANGARRKQAELLKEAQQRQQEAETARDRANKNWQESVAVLNEVQHLLSAPTSGVSSELFGSVYQRIDEHFRTLAEVNDAPLELRIEVGAASLSRAIFHPELERGALLDAAMTTIRETYHRHPHSRAAQTGLLKGWTYTALIELQGALELPEAQAVLDKHEQRLNECRELVAANPDNIDLSIGLAHLQLLEQRAKADRIPRDRQEAWLAFVLEHAGNVPQDSNLQLLYVHTLTVAGDELRKQQRSLEAEDVWRRALKIAETLPPLEQSRSSPPASIQLCGKLVPLLREVGREQDARDLLLSSGKNFESIISLAQNRGNLVDWTLRFAGLLELIGMRDQAALYRKRALELTRGRMREATSSFGPPAHDQAFKLAQRYCESGDVQQGEVAARLGWQAAESFLLLRDEQSQRAQVRRHSANRSSVTRARSQLVLCRLFGEQDSGHAEGNAHSQTQRQRILAATQLGTSPTLTLLSEEWGNELEWASMDNDLAWSLATWPDPKRRDPEVAVHLAKRTTACLPAEAPFWNTLGVAHYRFAQYDDAIAALVKSVELGGGSAEDWLFLAMAHHQLGNKDEASKQYDQAVAWIKQNNAQNEELTRFLQEARDLLAVSQPEEDGNAPHADEP
jgi:serine/threonine protein kinase